MSFKISHHVRKAVCGDYQMKGIIKNNISMEAKALLFAAEGQ